MYTWSGLVRRSDLIAPTRLRPDRSVSVVVTAAQSVSQSGRGVSWIVMTMLFVAIRLLCDGVSGDVLAVGAK